MGATLKQIWTSSTAVDPKFSQWPTAISSGKIQHVYVSDRRIDELQKDIKDLKVKIDKIEFTLISLGRESILTMFASEDVLRKDWNTPEEDKAWEDL